MACRCWVHRRCAAERAGAGAQGACAAAEASGEGGGGEGGGGEGGGAAAELVCAECEALISLARREGECACEPSVAAAAAAAARRGRRLVTARGGGEDAARAAAFCGAAYAARRTRRAFVHGLALAGQAASSSACRAALEQGGAELLVHVFSFVTDAWTLRSAACVCPEWRRLLDRGAGPATAALWSSAWLTAPRGRGWACLRLTRPGDRLRLLCGVHATPLELCHALEVEAERAGLSTLSGPLTLRGSAASSRVGVLRGVALSHFYNPAVTLLGGTWRLEHCSIESSRPKHRACAGVVLRGGARAHTDTLMPLAHARSREGEPRPRPTTSCVWRSAPRRT